MRVVHVIGGLGVGGAERMLQRLLIAQAHNPEVENSVISLTTLGAIGAELEAAKIKVESLGLTNVLTLPRVLIGLVRRLRRLRPDVVQTWLYHADLLGGLAARVARVKNIVWNIRCTVHGDSRSTNRLIRINARLSKTVPHSIVCCGAEAMRFHQALGFRADKMIVLPNGYDMQWLDAGAPRCHRNGVNIVMIGRNDVLKDYPNLLQAAAIVRNSGADVQFHIYGRGCPQDLALAAQVQSLDLTASVHFHDQITDIRPILRDADIFCSSSSHEGFPNVIAEAMAMGVPCVATDAGDAAAIIGNTGIIVPTKNPSALAQGLLVFSRQGAADRQQHGRAARQRILNRYEMGHVSNLYVAHYKMLVDKSNT